EGEQAGERSAGGGNRLLCDRVESFPLGGLSGGSRVVAMWAELVKGVGIATALEQQGSAEQGAFGLGRRADAAGVFARGATTGPAWAAGLVLDGDAHGGDRWQHTGLAGHASHCRGLWPSGQS